jgi:hypothetical protein
VRRLVGTCSYAVLLLTTAAVRAYADPDVARTLLEWSSSDRHHLVRNPAALLLSGLWTAGAAPWRSLLAVALVVAPLEWWLGTRRWLLTLILGHGIATLCVAPWMTGLDVGISYVTATAAAALTWALPVRWRAPYAVAVAVVFGWLAAPELSAVAAGHVIAFSTGLGSGWWFGRAPGRSLRQRPVSP